MHITYPHVIDNGLGERLIFQEVVPEADGDRLVVENFVAPGQGPVMHTHWLQDECLTVLEGRIGYQVMGQPEQFAGPSESVLFERGVAHRFWNAGDDVLHCSGWIKPANTIVYFLSSIYAAQLKTGSHRPELFDAAFLMQRYAPEYDLNEMPVLVKKVLMPLAYRLGCLLNKYEHFRDAPPATRLQQPLPVRPAAVVA